MATHLIDRGRSNRLLRPEWPFALNAESPRARDLVLWMPCVWPSQLFRDLSVYQRGATVTTAPAGTRGKWPYGAAWDIALSANITVADAPEWDASSFTVAAWTEVDVNSGAITVFSRGNGGANGDWILGNSASLTSTHRFVVRNNAATMIAESGAGYGIRVPTLLVGVCVGGTAISFYKDGVELATASGGASLGASAQPLNIGSRSSGGNPWDGAIWDVRVWNRAFTPAEVWALYDPQTRWDLYWQPSTRVMFDLGSAPAFNPAWARNANVVLGAGVQQ